MPYARRCGKGSERCVPSDAFRHAKAPGKPFPGGFALFHLFYLLIFRSISAAGRKFLLDLVNFLLFRLLGLIPALCGHFAVNPVLPL